jgi:cysteine synthase
MNSKKILENTIRRCRERGIIIPTYAEMADPDKIPAAIQNRLKNLGMSELHPFNLYRLTWKNDPVPHGGGFGSVNALELPPALTGIPARIWMLIGKHFPTGSHKVGATFGPLVEKLVRGAFDPTCQKALWPSTGNYCRGGAYDSALLACPSIAVLPEGMSTERFAWLREIGAEVHLTPGSESNVKEVYDRSDELARAHPGEIVVFNQFEEFGNSIWHYACTGPAIEEVFLRERRKGDRLAALFLTQGSTGTLGSADYLRERFPRILVGAGEALQCPTLLWNGYGEHRIEGIGDKHVPWIHNLRNTDFVIAVDDRRCLRLARLFNEPAGRRLLVDEGVDEEIVDRLHLLGISGIANLIGAVKTARYFELGPEDFVFTIATDSMELYQSRIEEMRAFEGEYATLRAGRDFESGLLALEDDHLLELNHRDRRRMHNLKYFTWVEQRGKTVAELDRQWSDKGYWPEKYRSYRKWDVRIREFNRRTGLLKTRG